MINMLNARNPIRLAVSLIATITMFAGGCSQRATDADADSTSDMRMTLQLPKGASVQQVTSGTARFVSDLLPFDSSMVAELTISDGAFEGRLDRLPGGTGTLTVNLFDATGMLAFQGTRRLLVIPGMVNEVTVPLAVTPQTIDNPIVYLHFDHDLGAIDSLIFRPGSNADLLHQDNNTELGQYGLGGVIGNEGGTILSRFEIGSNSAIVEYANEQGYGSKTFSIRWGLTIGLEIDMEYNITSDRQVGVGCSWLPGGDADLQRDSLVIYDGAGRLDAFQYTYGGQTLDLYTGPAAAVGMLDQGHDIIFGFRFTPSRNVICRQSNSADGPYLSFGPGTHSLSFAIKSELGFAIWSVGRN